MIFICLHIMMKLSIEARASSEYFKTCLIYNMKVADDNELNLLQNIFAYFNAFSDCNILQSMSCKHDFLRLKWHCHSEKNGIQSSSSYLWFSAPLECCNCHKHRISYFKCKVSKEQTLRIFRVFLVWKYSLEIIIRWTKNQMI